MDLLGLQPGASESEIKKAYKKMAMIHHPDKGGDPEKFKQLTAAYEDALRPKPKIPQQHVISVPQADAYRGTNKMINITMPNPCPGCFCVMCGHTGQIQLGPFRTQCPNPHRQCPQCSITTDTYHLEIPKGTMPGTVIHISTNVSFVINVEPDTVLTLEGTDLVYNVKISFKESLVGTTISIPHYDGTFEYRTGFIKPSKKYLIKGRGFKKFESNLIFRFTIEYPEKLTEEQIDAFKKYL